MEKKTLLQWKWDGTSMVSLLLYSSGGGGVTMLVSGNNAVVVLVILCCWNIEGSRKGSTTQMNINCA